MRRVAIAKPKTNPHFIGSWQINDLSICDKIISNFENENLGKQSQGTSGFEKVDLSVKNSKDISIIPNELSLPHNNVYKEYLNFLASCYKDYSCQWPFIKETIPSVNIGTFNVQRYTAGQHFSKVHTERNLASMEREFAFMTYLNNVEFGGSTHFEHYGLEIKPQKGLTLIWPAMWTHAHKGNVINSGIKYIITGWMDLGVELASSS